MPITKTMMQVYCPSCGKEMIERRGKYGPFYGCSTYPRCRKVVNIDDAHKYSEPPVKAVSNFDPSTYQVDILDFVLEGEGNGVVEACPGSGKTTTNVWVGNHLDNFLGVAFNVHIKNEWADRTSRGKVVTTHSLGLWTIRRHFNSVKVDNKKIWQLVWPMVNNQSIPDEDKKALGMTVKKLVDLVRATLNQNLEYLCDRFGIPLNGDKGLVEMLVRMTLQQDKAMPNLVDFGDMLWLPHVLHLQAPQFPMILADECQDFNRAQTELILNALEPGGRICMVGDRNQSLYGFRGADTESIPNLISRLDAITLPLPISYRCPKKVVELAQMFVPEMQYAPWAEDGEVQYVSEGQALDETEPGDMILCRCNAPLVRPIYALIRRGIKATIRGRDIGKGLVTLIEKHEPKVLSLHELLVRLDRYKEREVAKFVAADKGSRAQAVEDRVDTIWALSEGCDTIGQLKERTESIFSDSKAAVVGSSVHRAKGLEADRVVILRPDLMPHPLARKDWERVQEKNCMFVACTRAKKTLVYAEPMGKDR